MKTTDNQKEQFIVVDCDDNIIGYRTRYECHHDKRLIHRTVGVLIYDDKGQVLLQKRSMTKDTNPGVWGISCAGHVTKGQTYLEAVKRELREELGIELPVEFKKRFIAAVDIETEMDALFEAHTNGPFFPNSEEVDRVEFFDVQELPRKIETKEIILSECAKVSLKEAGIL